MRYPPPDPEAAFWRGEMVTRGELQDAIVIVHSRIDQLSKDVSAHGTRLAWIMGGIGLIGFEIPVFVGLIAAGVIKIH